VIKKLLLIIFDKMEKDNRKCKEHPSETITNFCARSNQLVYVAECLAELCAACICDHT